MDDLTHDDGTADRLGTLIPAPGPQRYRKRPVEIEAMVWDGTVEGATAIIDWALANGGTARYHEAYTVPALPYFPSGEEAEPAFDVPACIRIDTLEGTMEAGAGSAVIRGVQGEFYPCKGDIFAETYERV
jgi:hypothetical protein